MSTRTTFFVCLIAAFLAGSLAGLATGAFAGYRSGTASILNSALVKDAREVGVRVATLDHLWLGDSVQAITRLEAGLDDILVGFDPDEPYSGLDQATVAALSKAIEQAKAYRVAHPWPSTDKHVRSAMVRNLFARGLYKPADGGRRP
jgi:hypothetical protein